MLFQKLFKPAASAPAGIQLVGAKTATGYVTNGSTVSLTDLTGGLASAPAIGDVVVVMLGTAETSTAPQQVSLSGVNYALLVSASATDTCTTTFSVRYKVLTSADTSVYISGDTRNDMTGSWSAYISVWRGVDNTYPFDVATATASAASTILANPPSRTPRTTGSYLIAGGTGAHTGGVATFSSSDLTDFRSAGVNASTTDSLIGGGYKQWTSGAFDPAAFTCSISSSSTYSNVSATLVLREAGQRTIFPTVVASASDNGAGTVTVPAHQAGDWIVFVNGVSGSITAPALTSGFTSITTFNNNDTVANDRAARAQYKVSDGTITSLSCSTYGGVVILRNVTGIISGSTKTVSTTLATPVTSFSVTISPSVPSSLCIFSGYDPYNFRSASGDTTTVFEFGGKATTGATSAVINGSFLNWVSVFPCYWGAEFY